jgi:hypothetical protein
MAARREGDTPLVEFLTDASHRGIPQCFTPRIDPEHPFEVVASFGHEVFDCPSELFVRPGNLEDVILEFLQRGSRIVRERFGEQRLLRIEVIVNEARRYSQTLRDIRHTGSRESSLDDNSARCLEDLLPSLFDGLSLHEAEHSLGRHGAHPR